MIPRVRPLALLAALGCRDPAPVDTDPGCVEVCTSTLGLALPDDRESFVVQLTAEGFETQVLSCPEEWINGTLSAARCAPGRLEVDLEGQLFPAALNGSLDGGPSRALDPQWEAPVEVCDTRCAVGEAEIG